MPANSAPTADLVAAAQSAPEPIAMEARLELLKRHRPLLTSAVRKANVPSQLRLDASQAAIRGFLEALIRFDPSRGTSIGTFAMPFIKGAVLSAAFESKVSMPTIVDVMDLRDEDEPGQNDPALDAADIADAVAAVRAFVGRLPRSQQRLLHMVFVDGLTQADAARARGVSRAAVNQTLAGIYRRGKEELRAFAPASIAA